MCVKYAFSYLQINLFTNSNIIALPLKVLKHFIHKLINANYQVIIIKSLQNDKTFIFIFN